MATKKKLYWAVYLGQRWSDRVFIFTDAESAGIFAQSAMLSYSKEWSDYNDNFQVSISVISEEEYNEKIRKYSEEHPSE